MGSKCISDQEQEEEKGNFQARCTAYNNAIFLFLLIAHLY